MNSFHQTAVNFTGQNFGACKFDRIKKILIITLLSVSTVGLILGIAAVLTAKPLLSIYITDSAEAIKYGVVRLQYICMTYLLCGIMDVMTGMLRGIGSSFAPMIISVLGVCGIRIGWICTLFQIPKFHTIESLYISYPVSWIITFTVELIVFLIFFKQKKNSIIQKT